jgi:predicted DNA-binding protein with PD1-like motif
MALACMAHNMNFKTALFLTIWALFFHAATAQEYVSPTRPAQTGRSPGVKVKLISAEGPTKTYAIIFAPGDEILSGLQEFAARYDVRSAHFTAIGDAKAVKFGWYDKSKKMFKVTALNSYAEITSLVGDIALINGKPSVHAHIAVATEDGVVHGGHLLEAFVEPTLEVMMTVEPVPLNKRSDPQFGINVIDPEQ